MNGVALIREKFGIDLSRDPVAHFSVEGVPGVDKITVARSPNGPRPFRAMQFYKKNQFKDGEYWLDERDDYVINSALERQVAEHVDVPLRDVQLEKESVETYGYTEQ